MSDHASRSGHQHDHGVQAGADKRYLWAALGLILGLMAVEVVVAARSGSLALLSDAGHMLSDAGALAGALWAMRLATRPATTAWTFGLARAEILSAAANGITLLVVAGILLIEAIRRLVDPPPVAGVPVIVVAVLGVAVNLVATWLLARANRSSLNIEGAYQHILTDLYGFLGTLIAGVVIALTGWQRADPIATLIVVALMARAAWGLLRESGRVLLQAAPEETDVGQVRTHLLSNDHVYDVHDLHAWTVTSGTPVLSAHVVVQPECLTSNHAPQLLDELQHCLTGHFDVEHSTFQLEPSGHVDHEKALH